MSSGRMTRRKVSEREAPMTSAASSYDGSSFSSTGCTARTTNGMPTNTSAMVMPTRV